MPTCTQVYEGAGFLELFRIQFDLNCHHDHSILCAHFYDIRLLLAPRVTSQFPPLDLSSKWMLLRTLLFILTVPAKSSSLNVYKSIKCVMANAVQSELFQSYRTDTRRTFTTCILPICISPLHQPRSTVWPHHLYYLYYPKIPCTTTPPLLPCIIVHPHIVQLAFHPQQE